MKFKKEQYKRLTIVLIIPLLLIGFYLKTDKYYFPENNYLIATCQAFSDQKKLDLYEPKCEALSK